MTQREAQFFVRGIQFAFGSLDERTDEQGIRMTLEVVTALGVDVLAMVRLTPEIHAALDRGGFRGLEAQRRARQENDDD